MTSTTRHGTDRLAGLRSRAHLAMHEAQQQLNERTWSDPVYVSGRAALDAVLYELSRAKWLQGQVDRSGVDFAEQAESPEITKRSAALYESVIRDCVEIRDTLAEGRVVRVPSRSSLRRHNEITFAEETPIVPSICPVVVLEGSNHDMGFQYAQQVIDIYGTWIFERLAVRPFTADQRSELRRWEIELRKYAPEVLDFAHGWSDGATAAGVGLDYDAALRIWTGSQPPATKPLDFVTEEDDDLAGQPQQIGAGAAAYLGEIVDRPVDDMCSGACAWGAATTDGSLVTGASTDHDCTFQATIVAYPDIGNAFVYTPFSVNGSTPVLGRQYMAGHPGFNSAGVAYVHHGGAFGGEDPEEYGYGIRRGAATFHILQFADSANEARDMMLSWPVGDQRTVLGSAGGMFADATSGFSMEARSGAPHDPRPIERTATYDAEGKAHDFLYGANNALDPRFRYAEGTPPTGYAYSLAGGWHATAAMAESDPPGHEFFRRGSRNSEGRNRYLYRTLMGAHGQIDLDRMTEIYRTGGTLPEGAWEEVTARWEAGEHWQNSAAHRQNAFVAVTAPGQGIYRACIGPARRDVAMRAPGYGYYYCDETNAFWELWLGPTPERLADQALEKAAGDQGRATAALAKVPNEHAARTTFAGWLDDGTRELDTARAAHTAADDQTRIERLARLARLTRAATRAQVRYAQLIDTVGTSTPA